MGDFLPQVCHNRMCGIYKLVEMEFMKEFVGPLLVSVEDRRFFSLEGFLGSSDWVQVLQNL